MSKLPRLLPLVAIAIGGVIAVRVEAPVRVDIAERLAKQKGLS